MDDYEAFLDADLASQQQEWLQSRSRGTLGDGNIAAHAGYEAKGRGKAKAAAPQPAQVQKHGVSVARLVLAGGGVGDGNGDDVDEDTNQHSEDDNVSDGDSDRTSDNALPEHCDAEEALSGDELQVQLFQKTLVVHFLLTFVLEPACRMLAMRMQVPQHDNNNTCMHCTCM